MSLPPTQGHATVTGVYTGTLIFESLRAGTRLEVSGLTARNLRRVAAGDVSAGQPELWSIVEIDVPDESVDLLAEALSPALRAEGGWYCDLGNAAEHIGVFAGTVFRYPTGDPVGREQAEAYGRRVGVPEPQLDWPEVRGR